MVISGIFDKVLIDKMTKTITARKMHSLFKKRTIPFSDVLRIHASSNVRKGRGSNQTERFFLGRRTAQSISEQTYWETVIELPGHKTVVINGISQQYPERFVIDDSVKKEAMVYMADEINKFMSRG